MVFISVQYKISQTKSSELNRIHIPVAKRGRHVIVHVKYSDKLQLYQVQVGKGIHVGIYAKGYNVRVNDTAKDMSISYVQSIPSTLAKLLPGSLLLAPTHGGIARDDTFVLHKSQRNTQLLNGDRLTSIPGLSEASTDGDSGPSDSSSKSVCMCRGNPRRILDCSAVPPVSSNDCAT